MTSKPPWTPREKFLTASNTLQSVGVPLVVCLAIAAGSRVWPGILSPEIQTAAEGGVVACLGALIWRFAIPKDRLTTRR